MIGGSLLDEVRRVVTDVQPEPKFRGAARDIQGYVGHEWMLAGPAETGKTWAGLWKLDTLLRSTPKARGVIVRKVRADMGSTVLATLERVQAIRGGVVPIGGDHRSAYDYPNGARLFVVGMDRPGKVLSGEFDGVYVNQAEELELNDWETVITRVTGRGAVVSAPWLGGDCNPGPETHWIRKRPTLHVLESRHIDNPSLYTDAGELTPQGVRTMGILDALTGVRKSRLRHGMWVSAEGIVYDQFDRAKHLIDAFPIPAHWRRIAVVDWGHRNPLAWQFWALDPDDNAFLAREIYRTNLDVADLVTELERLKVQEPGLRLERLEITLADHDPDKISQLRKAGWNVKEAEKSLTGIQLVQARLKAGRLKFFRDALVNRDEDLAERRKPVCTVDEFEVYVWPKDAGGREVKEVPVKLNDHGMDAMRYLVTHLDGPSAGPPPPARALRMGSRRPVTV